MFRFLRLGSVVASGALFASAAFGASISFNPASYGANPIGVTITLDDGVVSGATQITVAITDLTKIGDIRGVYFDLDAPAGFDPDADVLSVGGGPVTAVCEYTFYCGSGNFVYPWWNFDVALRIGYAGISGGDDYQTTTFQVNDTSLLNFYGQTMGVRVGDIGLADDVTLFSSTSKKKKKHHDYDDRDGWDKLKGKVPDAPVETVPEPATLSLLGGALLGLGALARRKSRS